MKLGSCQLGENTGVTPNVGFLSHLKRKQRLYGVRFKDYPCKWHILPALEGRVQFPCLFYFLRKPRDGQVEIVTHKPATT